MHEAEKIKQAQYHQQQMAKVEIDPEAFRYEVVALASAARSVLQYALKEAQTKPGGQQWYDGHVAASPLIRLFRDKRNADIHEEPLTVPKDIEVGLHEHVGVSESWTVELYGPDGKLKQRESSRPPKPQKPRAEEPPTIAYRYRFREWPGPEEVPALCERLLGELRAFVADGRQRGFLTP